MSLGKWGVSFLDFAALIPSHGQGSESLCKCVHKHNAQASKLKCMCIIDPQLCIIGNTGKARWGACNMDPHVASEPVRCIAFFICMTLTVMILSDLLQVEVKPYVLDDQMCDECHGSRCAGKFAPFFCANVTCLQYYCEYCWAQIHSRPGREFHKPLVKEGADRPRAVPFRWC